MCKVICCENVGGVLWIDYWDVCEDVLGDEVYCEYESVEINCWCDLVNGRVR